MILVPIPIFSRMNKKIKTYWTVLDHQGCQIPVTGLPDFCFTHNFGSNWHGKVILVSIPTFLWTMKLIEMIFKILGHQGYQIQVTGLSDPNYWVTRSPFFIYCSTRHKFRTMVVIKLLEIVIWQPCTLDDNPVAWIWQPWWSRTFEVALISSLVFWNTGIDTKTTFLCQLDPKLWVKQKIWQPCNLDLATLMVWDSSKCLNLFPCPSKYRYRYQNHFPMSMRSKVMGKTPTSGNPVTWIWQPWWSRIVQMS